MHNVVEVQWNAAHVILEGNVLADQEAKLGNTLPQTAAT